MRISKSKVLQPIDSEPMEFVIVDESTRNELVFTEDEFITLMMAVNHTYDQYMRIDRSTKS